MCCKSSANYEMNNLFLVLLVLFAPLFLYRALSQFPHVVDAFLLDLYPKTRPKCKLGYKKIYLCPQCYSDLVDYTYIGKLFFGK